MCPRVGLSIDSGGSVWGFIIGWVNGRRDIKGSIAIIRLGSIHSIVKGERLV